MMWIGLQQQSTPRISLGVYTQLYFYRMILYEWNIFALLSGGHDLCFATKVWRFLRHVLNEADGTLPGRASDTSRVMDTPKPHEATFLCNYKPKLFSNALAKTRPMAEYRTEIVA
ncbi:hypothetical protein P3342_007697 [Pyrenophora teres f. teres]|nr:hypothetical protein P3342_007697 [Pyrenophora teres f. teres]